jgi:RNA polymerase sigma factor (sigma-70 family)
VPNLQRAATDHDDSRAAVWAAWVRGLYAFARLRCRDDDTAAESVQECLTAAVGGRVPGASADVISGGPPGSDAHTDRAWRRLCGVVRHKLADAARRAGRHDRALALVADRVGEPAEQPRPEHESRRNETRRVARLALTALSPRHRAVLLAVYADDLTVPRAAARLGLTTKAAESLLGRARRAMATQIRRLVRRPEEDLIP